MGCRQSSMLEKKRNKEDQRIEVGKIVQRASENKEADVIVIPKQTEKATMGIAQSFLRKATFHKRKLEMHRNIVDFQRIVSSPTTSVAEYVDAIVDQATTCCNCEVASVFFYDEIKHDMWCIGSKDLEGFSIDFGEGIVGLVATTGKLVNLEDARTSKHFFSTIDEQTGFVTKSLLALPLTHPKNEKLTIGVLEVINKLKSGGGNACFGHDDILELKKLAIHLGQSFYRQRFKAIQGRTQGDAEVTSLINSMSDVTNDKAPVDTVEKTELLKASKIKKKVNFNHDLKSLAKTEELENAFVWPAILSPDYPQNFLSTKFDVLEYDPEHLKKFVHLILLDTGCIDLFEIPGDILANFSDAMMKLYRNNPFHNWYHGFGVMHFTYFQMKHTSAVEFLTHLEVFAVLIASLGHDADHPGFTNSFIVLTEDDIALRYNDISVLENHHASKTTGLLRRTTTMINISLSPADKRQFRKLIITSILATDMVHHGELCKLIVGRPHINPFDKQNPTDRQLVLKIMIHSSDLSIQTFPWNIASKWEQRISLEFARQAIEETKHGLTVLPFMQNLSSFQRRGKLQVDFIDFCLVPLWEPLSHLYFSLRPQFQSLKSNRSKYHSRSQDAYEPIDAQAVENISSGSIKDKQSFSNASATIKDNNPSEMQSTAQPQASQKKSKYRFQKQRSFKTPKRRTLSMGSKPAHSRRALVGDKNSTLMDKSRYVSEQKLGSPSFRRPSVDERRLLATSSMPSVLRGSANISDIVGSRNDTPIPNKTTLKPLDDATSEKDIVKAGDSLDAISEESESDGAVKHVESTHFALTSSDEEDEALFVSRKK